MVRSFILMKMVPISCINYSFTQKQQILFTDFIKVMLPMIQQKQALNLLMIVRQQNDWYRQEILEANF